MKKHKYHSTHIEHHRDGSHTVHHKHEDGEAHDSKHAAMGLDHLHDSIQDHLAGPPSEGDQDLDKGVHGVPAEHAGPAGLPMPQAGQ